MAGLGSAFAFPLGGDDDDDDTSTVTVTRREWVRIDAVGVTDGAELESVNIWASFNGGEDWEPVVVAGAFDARYQHSLREELLNGYRFRVYRNSGWPSASVKFTTTFTDIVSAEQTPGTHGPDIVFTPTSFAELALAEQIQIDIVGDVTDVLETSIGVWWTAGRNLDGTARWEAIVVAGEVAGAYYAGSTKETISGGFRYTIVRPSGWDRQAGRYTTILARATDVNGVMDGTTIPIGGG